MGRFSILESLFGLGSLLLVQKAVGVRLVLALGSKEGVRGTRV